MVTAVPYSIDEQTKLAALLGEQARYKSADTTRNNVASRTADTHLTGFTVVASGVYIVDTWLPYSASTGADIAFEFDVSALTGATWRWALNGLATNATSTTSATTRAKSTNNSQDAAGGVGVGTAVDARARGLLVVSTVGGAFGLKWGQSVAEVSDTVLYAGAWMKVTRIA